MFEMFERLRWNNVWRDGIVSDQRTIHWFESRLQYTQSVTV